MDKTLSFILLLSSLPLITCVKFLNATSDVFLGASQSCLDAVNADIACNGLLAIARADISFQFNPTDLTDLYTSDCFNALQVHRTTVFSKFSSTQCYDEIADFYFPPTILDDELIYGFNYTCLKSA